MKVLGPLFVAFALVSCKKEAVRMDAAIGVSCRQCLVEYTAGDKTGTDSLKWQIRGQDTLATTGRYNFVLEPGATIFVRACRYDTINYSGPVEISVTGDVQDLTVSAGPDQGCVTAQTEARSN